MQDELIDLQLRMKRTLVFITHDFTEALRLADRIAIMRDGEVVQIGTPVEIISKPANEYVRAFTKDAPKAKVLTAYHVLGNAGRYPGNVEDLARVGQWTVLEDIIPTLLASSDPVAVEDDSGRITGIVTHQDVSAVLTPEP